MKNKALFLLLWLIIGSFASMACTSMAVSARLSGTGRPMIWKHRDTGAKGNFLARVEATDSTLGYVALFNDGDSLLREAWMGMNDAGFAILNTATYNLHPYYKNEDGEGIVMSMALKECATLSDFEAMLDRIYSAGPSDIGINANFCVMDAQGGLAYYEADDYSATKFDAAEQGYLIYTNYSTIGDRAKDKGVVRCQNACHLLAPLAESGEIMPSDFTEGASRSFWQSHIGKDCMADSAGYILMDNDYIPRSISTSSIVIEGVNPGEDPSAMRMWAALGYPPCSSVAMVTLHDIPEQLGPSADGYSSPACIQANALRDTCMVTKGDGKKYIDVSKLAAIIKEKRAESMAEYSKYIY